MAELIKGIDIDISTLGASTQTRQLTITGTNNAKYFLQIFDNNAKFYNFTTRLFVDEFSPQTSLRVQQNGGNFSTSIVFPAATSATYTVFIYTIPNLDTTLASNISSNKYIYKQDITQVGGSTITFAPANSGSSMQTMPTATSTGSFLSTSKVSLPISWGINNVETDANGFGLRLIRQPVETDWYFQTTETVDGAITSATEVVVDDLTDIVVGMTITGVSSGSLSGTPTITAINTSTKKLTLSSAQTFADGITLTLKAIGSTVIQDAIGANIDFGTFTAVSAPLTKTVRTDASSTTVNLNGTYGIAGGGHVKISGLGVANTSANTVQSVSASSSAGSIVVQVSQEVVTGTIITFKGSTQTITITGTLIIKSYPDANRTINLNLDNFITAGAAS